MIYDKNIIQVARTKKTYGIRGEIIMLFSRREYAEADVEYYLLMIDGIPVPFFIEEFMFTTDVSARVKFEDVNDEKEISRYVNLDVFLPRNLLSDEILEADDSWRVFVGFSVIDQHSRLLGIINDVDDSTLNELFILNNGEAELLIPATEDFITAIDKEKKIIKMNLPDGLIED